MSQATDFSRIHGGDFQPSVIVRLYSLLSPAGPPRSVTARRLFPFSVSGLMALLILRCFHNFSVFTTSQVVMSSPWTLAAPTPARRSTRVPSQTTESKRENARICVTSKRIVLTGPFIALPLPLKLNLVTVLSTGIPTSTLVRRLAVTRTQILR